MPTKPKLPDCSDAVNHSSLFKRSATLSELVYKLSGKSSSPNGSETLCALQCRGRAAAAAQQWAGFFQTSPGEQVLGDSQLSFCSSSCWDPKDPVRGVLCEKK